MFQTFPIALSKLFPFPAITDRQGEAGHETTWTIPADLPYFEGHFPEQPVLPAVAILDATTCLIARATGKPGELATVVSAKFMAVIGPGRRVCIQLSSLANSEWLARWHDPISNEKLAELRVRWSS